MRLIRPISPRGREHMHGINISDTCSSHFADVTVPPRCPGDDVISAVLCHTSLLRSQERPRSQSNNVPQQQNVQRAEQCRQKKKAVKKTHERFTFTINQFICKVEKRKFNPLDVWSPFVVPLKKISINRLRRFSLHTSHWKNLQDGK